MNNLSLDLPVKLEELCKFTFSFNNLIKVINYLHQNNLNLSSELKDINQRLYSFESLKSDIEDIKIKSLKMQQSNENILQQMNHIKNDLSKINNDISEIHKKNDIFVEKITDLDKEKNAHEKNLNNLNQAMEENIKKINNLEENASLDRKKMGEIESKVDANSKKNDELKNNIIDINKILEQNKKNFEDINSTINNIIETTNKKNSELNNRILNIVNDIANVSDKVTNIPQQIITNIESPDNQKQTKEEEIIYTKVPEPKFNVNMNMETTELVKAIMDEVEKQKVKYNKLKDDLRLNKENQTKQNDTFRANISKIKEDLSNFKSEFDENIENITNNINILSMPKEDINESKTDLKKEESNTIPEEQPNLNINLREYVSNDTFKKLNDNVRILTSSLNLKLSVSDFEAKMKKFNQRLEDIEMSLEGQTHGPRPRINLELVNTAITKESLSEIPSEYRSELEEIDAWAKIIEKRLKKNIHDFIQTELDKIDKSSNERMDKIENNQQKNVEDIKYNNKTILDIKNTLTNFSTKNDINKIKTEQEKINKECKINRMKIEDIVKNIEGQPNDDDEEEEKGQNNNIAVTTYEKIKLLNRTCQTLNNKISSLENRSRSITKEVKDDVKQNLKIETGKIMQQFRNKLDGFTTRFEYELRNKIDQIGLTDFENKMNNKFYIDLREKLDKTDLKKNNNMLNRKIDNLESKISKTLVDTIIDLQMDEQPLIIKKNGNGVDVCASCNQPVNKINASGGGKEFINANMSNMNNTSIKAKGLNRSLNFTQPINMKSNFQNEKNLKINIGQNKLPDIIPNIYQK